MPSYWFLCLQTALFGSGTYLSTDLQVSCLSCINSMHVYLIISFLSSSALTTLDNRAILWYTHEYFSSNVITDWGVPAGPQIDLAEKLRKTHRQEEHHSKKTRKQCLDLVLLHRVVMHNWQTKAHVWTFQPLKPWEVFHLASVKLLEIHSKS